MRSTLAVSTVLVDDHDLFRAGLRALLAGTPDLEVVGEARNAKDAYAVIEATNPQVVVLDVSLGKTDGIAITEELFRRRAGCRILMLTMHAAPDCAVRALQAGALGYSLKDEPADAALTAIRAVAAGEQYLSPRLPIAEIEAQIQLRRSAPPSAGAPPLDALSRREREIFAMVVRGLANRLIAAELCISVKTVETHRAHINKKLGVHSGTELVRLAALYGLIA